MQDDDPGVYANGSARSESRRATTFGAADWLYLAAAPTFAIMALLGGNAPQATCLGMASASPLSGMGLMYLLMSIFHLAPWMKLVARR